MATIARVAQRPTGLKGLARARRAGLVERSSISLSRDAEEALYRIVDVLSEGELRSSPEGASAYYGSTMLTFDLRALERSWRRPLDEKARAKLAHAVEGSVRMRLRAMRIAFADARRRIPDRPLGTPIADTRVRLVGDCLHIDIDVEVPLGAMSRRGRR